MLANDAEYDADPINCCILYYDNFTHPSQIFNTDEIAFTQPVIIRQLRIVRNSINPHPNLFNKPSITQKNSIKNFEIFAYDLCSPTSKYNTVVESTNINEKNEKDYIIATTKQLVTQSIIVRGEYKELTIIVYGEILEEKDSQTVLKFNEDCIKARNFNSHLHLNKPNIEEQPIENKEIRFSNVCISRKKSFQICENTRTQLDSNALQLKEISQDCKTRMQQFAANYDEYVVFLQRYQYYQTCESHQAMLYQDCCADSSSIQLSSSIPTTLHAILLQSFKKPCAYSQLEISLNLLDLLIPFKPHTVSLVNDGIIENMFNIFFKDATPNYFKERILMSIHKILIYECSCDKLHSLKYTVTKKKDKHKKTKEEKKRNKPPKKRSRSNEEDKNEEPARKKKTEEGISKAEVDTSIIPLESFLVDMICQDIPIRIKTQISAILKRLHFHSQLKAIRDCSNNINDEKDLMQAKKILDSLLPAVKKMLKNDEDKQVIVISNLAAILLEEYSYLQILSNILCSSRIKMYRSYIYLFLSCYRHLLSIKEAENSLMFFLRSKNATDQLISAFEISTGFPRRNISWIYESEFELLAKEAQYLQPVETCQSIQESAPIIMKVLMSNLNANLVSQLKVMSMVSKENLVLLLAGELLNEKEVMADAMSDIFMRVYPLSKLLDEIKGDDDDHLALATITILSNISHNPKLMLKYLNRIQEKHKELKRHIQLMDESKSNTQILKQEMLKLTDKIKPYLLIKKGTYEKLIYECQFNRRGGLMEANQSIIKTIFKNSTKENEDCFFMGTNSELGSLITFISSTYSALNYIVECDYSIIDNLIEIGLIGNIKYLIKNIALSVSKFKFCDKKEVVEKRYLLNVLIEEHLNLYLLILKVLSKAIHRMMETQCYDFKDPSILQYSIQCMALSLSYLQSQKIDFTDQQSMMSTVIVRESLEIITMWIKFPFFVRENFISIIQSFNVNTYHQFAAPIVLKLIIDNCMLCRCVNTLGEISNKVNEIVSEHMEVEEEDELQSRKVDIIYDPSCKTVLQFILKFMAETNQPFIFLSMINLFHSFLQTKNEKMISSIYDFLCDLAVKSKESAFGKEEVRISSLKRLGRILFIFSKLTDTNLRYYMTKNDYGSVLLDILKGELQHPLFETIKIIVLKTLQKMLQNDGGLKTEAERLPKQQIIQRVQRYIQASLDQQSLTSFKDYEYLKRLLKLILVLSSTVVGSYSMIYAQNDESTLSLEKLLAHCLERLKEKDDAENICRILELLFKCAANLTLSGGAKNYCEKRKRRILGLFTNTLHADGSADSLYEAYWQQTINSIDKECESLIEAKPHIKDIINNVRNMMISIEEYMCTESNKSNDPFPITPAPSPLSDLIGQYIESGKDFTYSKLAAYCNNLVCQICSPKEDLKKELTKNIHHIHLCNYSYSSISAKKSSSMLQSVLNKTTNSIGLTHSDAFFGLEKINSLISYSATMQIQSNIMCIRSKPFINDIMDSTDDMHIMYNPLHLVQSWKKKEKEKSEEKRKNRAKGFKPIDPAPSKQIKPANIFTAPSRNPSMHIDDYIKIQSGITPPPPAAPSQAIMPDGQKMPIENINKEVSNINILKKTYELLKKKPFKESAPSIPSMPPPPPPLNTFRPSAPLQQLRPSVPNYNLNQIIQMVGYENVMKAMGGQMPMQYTPLPPPPKQMAPSLDFSQLTDREKEALREIEKLRMDPSNNKMMIYSLLEAYPNIVPILKNMVSK